MYFIPYSTTLYVSKVISVKKHPGKSIWWKTGNNKIRAKYYFWPCQSNIALFLTVWYIGKLIQEHFKELK